MGLKSLVNKEDLDSPVIDSESIGYFKKGKTKIILFFEDGSHKEYFMNLGQAYFFTISKANYLIVPRCISRGKTPTIMYYFNNPLPILFDYSYTSLSSLSLRTKEEILNLKESEKIILANTFIDAQAIKSAFDSRLLNSLYATNKLTVRSLIIILVVVTIISLILLQVFGVVDVIGMFTDAGGTK